MNVLLCFLPLIFVANTQPYHGYVSFSKDGRGFAIPTAFRFARKTRIEVTASGKNPFRIGVVSNIPNGRNLVERLDQTDCTTPKPESRAHFQCSLSNGSFSVVIVNQGTKENDVWFEISSQ